MDEVFQVVGLVVLVFSIIIGGGFLIGMYCEKRSCQQYQEVTGRETQYKNFGGCFVKTSSGWLTKEEYGQVIVAKESLSKEN